MDTLDFLAVLAAIAFGLFVWRRWLGRRRAGRALAAAHGLRFRGIIPSDKHAPYCFFPPVNGAVLLHGVVEGQRNGSDVYAFDYPRRGGTQTGVIVALAGDQRLDVEALRQRWPRCFTLTQAAHVFVTPGERLPPDAWMPLIDSIVGAIVRAR